MSEIANPAGGRATEAGMTFQAAVTTWFAVQMLVDAPVGSAFGLPVDLKISALQCETGDAIDDIVVRLDGGGTIYVQCKTRPALTAGADSPLAKALGQVVDLYAREKERSSSPKGHVRALLAIAEDAPHTLDTLNDACRLFDHGGIWAEVISQATDQVRDVLRLFEAHVRTAWPTYQKTPLEAGDLVSLARLFQIRRFPEDVTSEAWRNAAHVLGRALYGSEGAGEAPMSALLGLSRNFIRTGAPVDRAGILRGLRAAGHLDVSAPGYDRDIEVLLAFSREERRRLSKHMTLPIDGGIPIARDCFTQLRSAVETGSLLVTGEPGAGKTGVLLMLANQLEEGPGPVVFLSVERFSGFRKRRDFRDELKLDHDLIEVLGSWPGAAPGVLIVDALDASRGGPSEAVIALFIEDAVHALGARWSIVASIRSFDLRNGRRFREIMTGEPPNQRFAEQGLGGVRHFQVPRLSPEEVGAVASASPRLRELEAAAPDKLTDLLRNIFNLSLAAELLSAGEDPRSIRTVATQSELIRRYEDIRLPSQPLRLAVKAAVQVMVRRRQLTVRATDIENDAVEEVRQSGVLTSAGDSVAFAHHVLFDHIAARFFLSDDPVALRAQITEDPTLGLMIGPALRFRLEDVWQGDLDGRPKTWGFLASLAEVADPDPAIFSIALRTVAERVDVPSDVNALCALIESGKTSKAVGRFVGQLARFVGMAATEGGRLSVSATEAWARVACVAAATKVPRLADAARVLLMTIAERGNLSAPSALNAFGAAARTLLNTAWSLSPEHLALSTTGIRLVAKSYETDPDASRALLSRILDERFEDHAPQEAPWLAEGVKSIIPHDPDFVARIYATLFGREIKDETKTWLGGSPSRILPLTSTNRQDYEHARWQLNEALGSFLKAAPGAGTAAVVGAVQGLDNLEHHDRSSPRMPTRLRIGERDVQVIDDLLSLQDWREKERSDDQPLRTFADFLRTCSQEAFREAVMAALGIPTNASVWARLLGVAGERPDVADDLLWPLAADPHFTALQGLSRDAVIFLAAAYERQSLERRSAFELAVLVRGLFPTERETSWWESVLKRFLSLVNADFIVTPEMRSRRSELDAAGELKGNPPFLSTEFGWGSEDDVVGSLLRSQGADLERSPDREIRAASRNLEERLKQDAKQRDAAYLVRLWADIVEVVRLLDHRAAEAHRELVHSSWGAVSNGVEQVAKSTAYSPEADGLPNLDALLAMIDRLSLSPYPEWTDTPEDHMSWGNWDVRVYAASSLVALAPRFAGQRSGIVDRMAVCLRDATPTVRLQVAQGLNVLWDVARDRMWSLVQEVADHEMHKGVLNFFVVGPLRVLSREEPGKTALILDRLLQHDWGVRGDELRSTRSRDSDSFAHLAAFLSVAQGQDLAWNWLERWASELRYGAAYIVPMLHNLRRVFFFPYASEPKPDQIEMASRARKLLDLVVSAAVAATTEARPHLLGSPSQGAIDTWRPLYEAGDAVLRGVCSQLYFGSGALRSPGDGETEIGLSTPEAKRRFFADHAAILDAIATHAQAGTVHQLFELLSYLVEGDPSGVFDRIAKILLGPAAADGYQFESLGLDSLVKLIRLYLADYREIFDDTTRRRTLVAVLELFSSAGWPEALKLLFELPDLLR